jgi:integrase
MLLTLALTTGMRLRELLELHWQDIYFDNGWLQVRCSVSRVRG